MSGGKNEERSTLAELEVRGRLMRASKVVDQANMANEKLGRRLAPSDKLRCLIERVRYVIVKSRSRIGSRALLPTLSWPSSRENFS